MTFYIATLAKGNRVAPIIRLAISYQQYGPNFLVSHMQKHCRYIFLKSMISSVLCVYKQECYLNKSLFRVYVIYQISCIHWFINSSLYWF